MLIPPKIIDNSEGNTLASFLNEVLEAKPDTKLDVASAFFDVRAYSMVKDNLNDVSSFKLLLGKVPEIKSDRTLGKELLRMIGEEVEGLDLTKEDEFNVKNLIEFLKRDDVEVRLYEKEFLHGKAYIFENLVVIGSSNFTVSGLTHNTELNSVSLDSEAVYTRERWFNQFWKDARDFKAELIELLENSRYGSREYTPYEIYIKALYELQKEEIIAEKEEKKRGLPSSKVNLAEFQADTIKRIFSRFKKYGGVLLADSVGLGKTWIAKKVLEDIGYYERKNVLVICPAQLRGMWRDEMRSITVTESILSQEEMASSDFLDRATRLVPNVTDIELIVVDESHNFRNPLSNRWENFFTLVNDHISTDGKKPYILFLTATPINNTIWDLYWQVMLMVSMDRSAFVKENISDLFEFFKDVDKKENPSLLGDLLNEISIRRNRDYIKKNHPDAYILKKLPDGVEIEQKIEFPTRTLESINYELGETYQGMYKEIADVITDKLTMAYYRILQYKKEEELTEDEELTLGRMIALEGIFRTILLKRLESSVNAFRISIDRHVNFLTRLKAYLSQGKLLTKKSFNKHVINFDDESDDFVEELEDFKLENYRKDELLEDIDNDIETLSKILEKVRGIRPEEDAKLNVLKERLLRLSDKGQIVLFTYYTDTLEYIYKEILSDRRFSDLRIEAISGSGQTTGKTPNKREEVIRRFFDKEVDVLMSTDVLSEGMNLQTAQFLINYDLHWNPTRMIQRAGRIDRIGSPYKEIYVYNFFPEDELEELLRLVQILQGKIIKIDESIGLDQTILGEEIHPKVFGVIRRIKEKDSTILGELEKQVYGGGERFYQPLKEFLREKAIEELEGIPYGVHSGLKKNKISGVFFYYQYGDDFHFWYLYDMNSRMILKNKTEIIDFIECSQNEPRVIPDFFEKIYEINGIILEDIENTYKELEQKQSVDSALVELGRDSSTKFVNKMVREIESEITEYLSEFPEDREIVRQWDKVKGKLLSMAYTKKRLSALRKMRKQYKNSNNWKKLIGDLDRFLSEKSILVKEPIPPFDEKLLKLVVVDLIS